MAEEIKFDSSEILCLFNCVGHAYCDLMEFTRSHDFDKLEFELQEVAVEQEAILTTIYKKMADYIDKFVPGAKGIYDKDVKFFTTPKKDLN